MPVVSADINYSMYKSQAEMEVGLKIELPDKVKFIINKLMDNGFDAYAVGGCVRDSILGRIPDDWDITTSAKPDDVKSVFKRTIDTGIEHGTVTVMLDKEGFEVTTYRIDGEYEDSRHPKSVEFTSNLYEDLRRRDFTVNAMAYNDATGIVDKFDGIGDLENGIVRCVGEPSERFEEDALRILRAVRFSAQLDFEIEERTFKAMKRLSLTLAKISAERIQAELAKLLTSNNPIKLKAAYEAGITSVIMPEFDKIMQCSQNNPHHIFSVGEHTLKAVANISNDRALRLTMLFHDIGKPDVKTTDDKNIDHFYNHAELSMEYANNIMRRLRFDNDTRNKVCLLVKYHDLEIKTDKKAVRRAVNKVGEDNFFALLEVKRSDVMAQSSYKREQKLTKIQKAEELFKEIVKDNECTSLKMLAINGKDLIDNGIKPGKQLGEILKLLLNEVLENPKLNNKEYLISKSLKIYRNIEQKH